jgi:hypothetical protein
MNIVLRALIALVLGAIAYFVAHLLLNETLSTLIGIVVGALYFFGDGWRHP